MFSDLFRALLGVPGFSSHRPPGIIPKGWHQHRGVGTTRLCRTHPARFVLAHHPRPSQPASRSWRLAVTSLVARWAGAECIS